MLPNKIRRKLGLQPGDALDAEIKGRSVVLTPRKRRARKAKIIIDRRTGLPVLTVGPNAPILTNKEVEEMLADFP